VSTNASSPDDSKGANWDKEWAAAHKLQKEGTVFNVKVEIVNRGGLVVRLGKLKAFIPASQISSSLLAGEDKGLQMVDKMATLVGQTLAVRVIMVNAEERQLVLSEKAVATATSMTSVQVGDACEGRVQSVADFGAFVELYKDGAASGVEGLVHLSEMSWDRVANPREAVKVGQVVTVKVISVDVKTQRIGLSMRQLMADPLLQTLDTLMPVVNLADGLQGTMNLPPFPDLENICEVLLAEEGVKKVTPMRQAREDKVVSPDLQLWLTTCEVEDGYNLLLRAGSQVQELMVTTPLARDDFKDVVRRVSSKICI